MTEDDLMYAAGFLDGEGCFSINDHKISVSSENTYKPVIDWLYDIFGGSVNIGTKAKNKWRNTYRWQVCGDNALEVCQILAPILKEKNKQALLLISFQQLQHFTKRGIKVPREIIEERDRLQLLCKLEKGSVE